MHGIESKLRETLQDMKHREWWVSRKTKARVSSERTAGWRVDE